jgi:ATP/maltotriose-dependent transcriptional regulator MalT/DNA-binding SARP family transcriptional activator
MANDRLDHPSARLSVPSAAGLVRPRLLRKLDRLMTARLGLVVAPAGAGKTTVMAQWARRVPVDVAWYRADAADATQPRLVHQLGSSLARARPRVGWTDVTDVDAMVADIERRESPMVLVVDDFQLVEDTPAEAEFQRLLLLAPPHLRVLVGARRRPSLNFARTELPCVVVTAEELRFTSVEAEQLFRDVYADPLTPEDAVTLTSRTEGWAAALQLFHLSVEGRPTAQRRRAVRALGGRVRYARQYLAGEVLRELPKELEEFVRQTCVYDVLTADRCDALLDTDMSQRYLLDLERRQALTVTDDDGVTFRYHEVLRRHLQTELLEDLGRSAARAWYGRAADILEREGAISDALRARARAEDWASVRRLVSEHGPLLVGAAMTTWLDLLPRWLVDEDPWLELARARRLLDDGRLAAAEASARRAEPQLSDASGKALCRHLTGVVSAWSTPWAPSSSGGGQPGDRVERWDEILRAATRRDPLTAAKRARQLPARQGSVTEGLALLVAGDIQAARRVLGRYALDPTDDPRVGLPARLVLAALGDDPATAADAVSFDAARQGLTWLARVSRGVARAARAADGSAEDAAELAGAVVDCGRAGDEWGAVLLAAALCVAQLRTGRADQAVLEDLATRLRALDAPALEAWARAALALVTTSAELPDSARDARSAESLARAAGVPGAVAVSYAALARVTPAEREELLELADTSASGAGLTVRPWSWLTVALPAAREAQAAEHAAQRGRRDATRRVVEPSPPTLSIRCFGRFELRVGGRPPDLRGVRPRARAVLRILALHAGRPVHRELLVDAMWRDLDPVAGMHNLHVCVSSLRAMLEPGVPRGASRLLVRDGDRYQLVLAAGSACDLRDFDVSIAEAEAARSAGESATAAAAFSHAVDLYTGDVLPEDGPAEWVIGIREHYRVRAAEAAGSLAELLLSRRDPSAAAAAALRSLDVDPCRDASWRLLLSAYTAAGDLAAAEQARRSYADVLTSLGVVSDSTDVVLPRPRRRHLE